MKCQNLVSGKNKKNISKWCLLEFLPNMLSVKGLDTLGRFSAVFNNGHGFRKR